MAKKYSKILLVLLALLAFLVAGCGAPKNADSSGSAAKSTSSAQAAKGNLTIQMLNVGQGDAILVKTAEQTVLIDTSDVDERDKLQNELQKAGVQKIDKVILTHPHADHIGGMDVLLDGNYQVGAIYDNGMPSTSKLYLGYMKKAKAKNIPHQGLKEGDTLDLGGGVKFEVLSPTASLVKQGQAKGYKHNPNNESVDAGVPEGRAARSLPDLVRRGQRLWPPAQGDTGGLPENQGQGVRDGQEWHDYDHDGWQDV